jgi:hypothetical protein
VLKAEGGELAMVDFRPNGGAFTQTVMELAAAVEAQEHRIRGVLLKALEEGDVELGRRILREWIDGPVSSVIARLEASERVQHGGVCSPPEEAGDAGSRDVSRVDGEAGQRGRIP